MLMSFMAPPGMFYPSLHALPRWHWLCPEHPGKVLQGVHTHTQLCQYPQTTTSLKFMPSHDEFWFKKKKHAQETLLPKPLIYESPVSKQIQAHIPLPQLAWPFKRFDP